MSHLIHKQLDRDHIWAVAGDGPWIVDREGRRYLDTCGGVAVSSLGHSHPAVIEAIRAEVEHISWAHAGTFTNRPAEALADLLVELSDGAFEHVQFLSGGSEVMELSLKTAYQYHCERGEPERQRFVARRQNYHGSTLGTLAISGNRQRRSIFEPMLGRAEFVSPCYAYRDQADGETEADYATRLATELEMTFEHLGPGTVAGFVLETVVGSTAGAVPPVDGYLPAVKEVCERHGVLLILDEVMAGMGRTGHAFAFQEYGATPDICAVGKGLAAGYQPVAAMLLTEAVHATLVAGSGVLRNGQTHVNHPVACAAGLAAQRAIAEEGLLPLVRERGIYLRERLRERFADVEQVGDVRGRGLFVGIEFVEERASKRPIAEPERFAARLKAAGLERELLTYPGSGTIDGAQGAHVLLAPPFISTEAELDEMVDRLGATVESLLPSLAGAGSAS